MTPITSILNQPRLQAVDFNFPAEQLNRKFMGSSSISGTNLVGAHNGGLVVKQYNSDHRSSIEAKMLNGCGVEIRRHSFPGSLPRAQEFLSMGNQNGSPRDPHQRVSLDSIGSKSVFKYPTSTSSLFLKPPPASWLDVKKDSTEGTQSALHKLQSPPDQTDSSNSSSPDSDSSSGIRAAPKSSGSKGLTLPAVKSVAVSNSRARYSPMFIQHDSFSSPFTSPTIFDKSAATNHIKVKEPKQVWTPSSTEQYVSEPNSIATGLKERNFDTQIPAASGRSGFAETRPRFSSARTPPGSALRSEAFEFSPKPLPVSSGFSEIKKPMEVPDSQDARISFPSIPRKDLTPDTNISVTSNLQPGLPQTPHIAEGSSALPNISGLTLTDQTKKAVPPPLQQKEKNGSQLGQEVRRKSISKHERYDGDSDIDTNPSDTDSEFGDIQERELSGIESSEIDSEEDPSRARSFWQAKRGNQGMNSVTVSVLELYKTEICLNWLRTRNCSYGNKCHYAHGMADLRTRQRIETYKTQPCADPARNGCHVCMYTSRCNYAHPGEPIRRMGPFPGKKYFDPEYFEALRRDYPYHEIPFGVFV